MSISEGIVPDELNILKIIPVIKCITKVIKVNAKDDICNYRPISLLPSIYNILGKVVYKMYFHLIKLISTSALYVVTKVNTMKGILKQCMAF